MSVIIVAFVALGIGLLLSLVLAAQSRRDRWRLWQQSLVDIRRLIEEAEQELDEREIEPVRLALLRHELDLAKDEWRELEKLVHAGDIDSDESNRLAHSSYAGALGVLESAEAYPRIGSRQPPVPPPPGGN